MNSIKYKFKNFVYVKLKIRGFLLLIDKMRMLTVYFLLLLFFFYLLLLFFLPTIMLLFIFKIRNQYKTFFNVLTYMCQL